MMNPLRSRLILLSLVVSAGALTAAGALERSGKRGVSANNLTSDQIALLAPGVSWIYNWGPVPGGIELDGEIEFIPFVWGKDQGQLDGVKAYLDGGATPSAIFFLNEPNYVTPLGSFVPPQEAAAWLETVRSTLSDYSEIPIIGPHMALGGAAEDSITAYDPIQEKMVTYTTAPAYLDAFDYYVGDGVLDGLSFHTYGNGEMEYWVDTFYERVGEPVWITEFAWMGSTDVEAQYDYMLKTLDYLEHSPKVERYAWFKADFSTQNLALKLLETRVAEATLTPLGALYVNYPAFDPEYFYPVPGRIDAESYVTKENMIMGRADSSDGWGALSLLSSRQEGWIEYQIDVAEAGPYRLRVRISSDGFEDLGDVPATAADADPPSGIERDLYFETTLEAGPQTLRLLVNGLSAKIDWLEFSR